MDKVRKKKIDVAPDVAAPTCPPLHTVSWKKMEPATKLPNGRWHVILERDGDPTDVIPAYAIHNDGEWYDDHSDEFPEGMRVTYYDHQPRLKG